MLIRAKVSALQLASFERMGISREDVPAFLAARRSDNSTFDPERDNEFTERLLASMGTEDRAAVDAYLDQLSDADLPFQCPVMSATMHAVWRTLFEVSPEGLVDGVPNVIPLLASAHSGEVNASTLAAEDGRAIVFEEGIISALQMCVPFFWPLVAAATEEGAQIKVPSLEEARADERMHAALHVIFELVLEYVTTGIMTGKRMVVDAPFRSMAELKLSRHLIYGAFQFVIGHEYGHIIGQHYELLRGEVDRHMPMRTMADQESMMAELAELGASLDDLAPDRLQNFLHWQMMELEADSLADAMLMTPAFNEFADLGELRGETALRVIGSRVPLILFVVLECVLAACHYGTDHGDMRLWGKPHVQDLLLRGTHPAPMTRIGYSIDCQLCLVAQGSGREELAPVVTLYHQAAYHLLAVVNDALIDWLSGHRRFADGPIAVSPKWDGMLRQLPQAFDVAVEAIQL